MRFNNSTPIHFNEIMKKSDLFIGIVIGIIGAFLGVYLFITLFTEYGFLGGIRGLKAQNALGKLISLGAVLNVVIFFILLKYNKELMARGVVLATILLSIITLFV